MTRIYCKGELVDVVIDNGWLTCTSCGKALWRANATFAVDRDRITSVHGNESQEDAGEEADAVPGGPAEAGCA